MSAPRDNCQCRIVPVDRGVTVEFCPMHAAAPEMLEALRGMHRASEEIAVEFIEHKRATNWGIVNDAYIAAARAIAKAEGK